MTRSSMDEVLTRRIVEGVRAGISCRQQLVQITGIAEATVRRLVGRAVVARKIVMLNERSQQGEFRLAVYDRGVA